MGRLEVARPQQLSAEQIADVVRISTDVTEVVGAPPLSDDALLGLRRTAADSGAHLLLYDGAAIVGYAHRKPGEPDTAELAVAPGEHSAERTAELVSALLDESSAGLQIWAHGERSGTARVLRKLGFAPARVLLQLRRSLDEAVPQPQWPSAVSVRTFVVGVDESAWLGVNNRAFATHPDQANWTLADLQARESEPWFDPDGFFLAVRDEKVVGFHWTKIHAGEPPIGEVYVVAADPSMRGQRLGPALTIQGMRYLRDRGLASVMLYVDESNTSAIRLYDELGFSRWDTDVCFSKR